jgi:hypothetical protein
VHGKAEFFTPDGPEYGVFTQAMLDWYLPRQGPEFEEWMDAEPIGVVRIAPEKLFTFHMDADA